MEPTFSVGRLGAPWVGTAIPARTANGRSLGAASQLQASLLPDLPRAQPLAAFFFSPSTAPFPIALALRPLFFHPSALSPHHQVDDQNHFRDPPAHLNPLQNPVAMQLERTLRPTIAEHRGTVSLPGIQYHCATTQRQTTAMACCAVVRGRNKLNGLEWAINDIRQLPTKAQPALYEECRRAAPSLITFEKARLRYMLI